jgi:Phosphomannomutase
LKKYNSKVIRTKVGSVEVSRKMLSTNALIGFEENGGFMFGKHNQVRDGCMSLALMLDLLATSDNLLSNEISKLPLSFTTKDKLKCSSDEAVKVISSLKEEFLNSDTSDGIKIIIDSKNWVMIRPSGTEPIIRIYAESESQEKLEALMIKISSKGKVYYFQITLLIPNTGFDNTMGKAYYVKFETPEELVSPILEAVRVDIN